MWSRYSLAVALTALCSARSIAAPAPVIPEGLGPYPVLQFFGGLMILGVGLVVYLRGDRERKTLESKPETGVKMFLDGPLVEFNKQNERQATAVEKLCGLLERSLTAPVREEMMERMADLVRELRDVKGRHDNLDERLRDVEKLCERLDERDPHRRRS